MKIFAVDIDLRSVPIVVVYPHGDVRNDIERGKRMTFQSAEVDAIPASGEIFQFSPPMNGRSMLCLAVYYQGVPNGFEAIVV